MGNRKKAPKETEVRVLLTSRRRCCLCFVYEKKDEECKGQIAHVDRDKSNNSFDNLAFLCLSHHDAYDGKPSQSKGWQPEEVRLARQILYDDFNKQKKLTIRIERDFNSLVDDDKAEITRIINNTVGRDVEITFKRGSVKLELELDSTEIRDLLFAMHAGRLDELGKISISLRSEKHDKTSPVLASSYQDSVLTAAVPRNLTLDTLANPDSWQEWNSYQLFSKRVRDKNCTVLVAVGGNAISLQEHSVMISLFLFHDEINVSESDAPIDLLDKFARRYAVPSYFHGLQITPTQLVHKNIETPFPVPVPPNIAWSVFQQTIHPVLETKSTKIAIFFYKSTVHPVIIHWMCIIDIMKYGDSLKKHDVAFPEHLLYPPKS